MPVGYETEDHVVTITIDRPDAMNALDPETSDELVEAWTRFRDDDALRVAVLTGAGERAFCAGADLKKMSDWYDRVPREKRREVWDREPGLGGITRNLDPGKPVIAAIEGHCLGGGLELALACDVRIAARGARFGLPETKWGILPGQGGTQRLPRVVGPNLALEMMLTAEPIDAERAQAIGLVNRLVDQGTALATAQAMAATIASRAPRAVRYAREAVHRGTELPLDEALKLEQSLAEPLRGSHDNREALEAFKEKREPDFTGR